MPPPAGADEATNAYAYADAARRKVYVEGIRMLTAMLDGATTSDQPKEVA